MLKIRITIGADSFEFEADAPTGDVLADVIPLIGLWFQALDPSTPIGEQIARLKAEREQLAAAVAAQGDTST